MSFEEAWVIVKNEPRERQHHPIKRRTTAPTRGDWEMCIMNQSEEKCPNRIMTGANGLESPLGLCASCYNRALDYEKMNRDPNDTAP